MTLIKHKVININKLEIENWQELEYECATVVFEKDGSYKLSTNRLTVNKLISDIIFDYCKQFKDVGELRHLMSGFEVIQSLDNGAVLKSTSKYGLIKYINGEYKEDNNGVYSHFDFNRIKHERFYEVK